MQYQFLTQFSPDSGAIVKMSGMPALKAEVIPEPETRLLASLATESQGYRFQNLGYSYDKAGNVKTLINNVALPGEGMGGFVSQTFGYDNLYRLTSASGTYRRQPDVQEKYTLAMTYDGIHNISRKNQLHGGKRGSGLTF